MLEENGIATVCVLSRRDLAELVKPPRALLTNFPYGAPLGPASDHETQMGVLIDALTLLETASEPGVIVGCERRWRR